MENRIVSILINLDGDIIVTYADGTTQNLGPADGLNPAAIEQAVADYLDEHPVVVSAAGIVSVADYGAVGDGITDDSAAIQRAVSDNYNVYFESNKTYYLGQTVNISHDIKLHGGENTKIITKSVDGIGYTGFAIAGTKKSDTTLASDYLSDGTVSNDCAGNRITLSDMSGIAIGDLIYIKATDQFYSYARPYYYLGGVFKVVDIYDGHLYLDRDMPWDLTNTASVTVSVYDAPRIDISNLIFEGDLAPWESGIYQGHSLLYLEFCKDVKITRCCFDKFTIGIDARHCVNTYVDSCSLAKSKYNNALTGDGYGIAIRSCTHTTIQNILSLVAQNCIDLGGDVPCIDTYISKCECAAESRASGIGLHENSYNIVIEDCVLGGLSLYGTARVNRCEFMDNLRIPGWSNNGIVIRGSHNPDWAEFEINDCSFGSNINLVRSPDTQNPVQAFDCLIGGIAFNNCSGGELQIDTVASSDILSNTINSINITNWAECGKIVVKPDSCIIKNFMIENSNITFPLLISDGIHEGFVNVNEIENLIYLNDKTTEVKKSVNHDTLGDTDTLPPGIPIEFSSDNQNAVFRICGKQLVSNNPLDYIIGTVTGNAGGNLSRAKATGSNIPTVSTDSNGDVVFSQIMATGNYAVYPIGMFYVPEGWHTIKMGALLVNSGDAAGLGFRAYIAAVNCKTGKIDFRTNGSIVTATPEGAAIEYQKDVRYGDCVILCYYYCATPVANSQATFKNAYIKCESAFAPMTYEDNMTYEGVRLSGDGVLKSLSGVNYIMSSEPTFHVKYQAETGIFS